jgi:hypothetical protein
MSSVPTTAQSVSWQFNYKHWSSSLVMQAINAAIDNLFPALYVSITYTITSDGESYEYDMPVGTETVEFVTGIDSRASTSDPWKRLSRSRKYEVFHDESTITARFFSAPQSGELRAHCICRPTRLTAVSDDIESVSGLPTRAQDLIVSYACYYLLTQKMAPRVRSDVGVTTQGIGVLMPSQMNYGAQGYMMRFQFQLASMRMHPWSGK